MQRRDRRGMATPPAVFVDLPYLEIDVRTEHIQQRALAYVRPPHDGHEAGPEGERRLGIHASLYQTTDDLYVIVLADDPQSQGIEIATPWEERRGLTMTIIPRLVKFDRKVIHRICIVAHYPMVLLVQFMALWI